MSVVDEFALVIPGKAHGQGRARSGQGRVYTPTATRTHAAKVQTEWIAAGRPRLADGTHYVVRITSLRKRPADQLNTKGELNAKGLRTPYPGKPDLDNEIKQYLDALVACGALPDDRFLVKVTADKAWALTDGPECVLFWAGAAEVER